jgi:hypothetical protein
MPPRPPRLAPKREQKLKAPKGEPPRFAPSAFLKGSTAQVQQLCEELASLAAERFSDLTGTSWAAAGATLAHQLRTIGHDLMNLEDSDSHQEWQATWHHPRGTFSLLLSFQAPHTVAVTWKTDEGAFTARR